MKDQVVLAYSGGLDTSVILKWLIDQGHSVVAYIADVGQNEDLGAAAEKALRVGAEDVVVDDLRQPFVEEFAFQALKAGAIYEGRYLLGTALARPLIARGLVETAERFGTATIAHGATGKGNDQVRFELAAMQLMPNVTVIVPWRTSCFTEQFEGRGDLLAYAASKGIPVEATQAKPYSTDANLWHVSYEAGELEDPAVPHAPDMLCRTVSPQEAPDTPTRLAIHFEGGVPVRVDNETTGESIEGSVVLLEALNKLGAQNGVGRIDIVENRFVGLKSRGVYETPGGTILHAAHLDLETLVLDRELFQLKCSFGPLIGKLIYNGLWFSPEMDYLMAAVEQSQREVTGSVRLDLYKGSLSVIARESPHARYRKELSSMECAGGYDMADATGFIRLHALRLRSSAIPAVTQQR